MTNFEEIKKQNLKTGIQLLVPMDFSKESYIALKYAISIAKLLKGKINIYHVYNPKETTTHKEQSNVDESLLNIKEKLNAIIEITKTENIPVSTTVSIGLLTSELKKHIQSISPNIIVIAKKKEKLSLSGELTSYLTNTYKGALIIVDKETSFQVGSKIAYNGMNKILDKEDIPYYILELNKFTKSPLVFFKTKNNIIPNTNTLQEIEKDVNIQLEHLKNQNSLDELIKYVNQNDIKLLCLGRENPKKFFQSFFSDQSTVISKIFKEIKIPILLMANNPF